MKECMMIMSNQIEDINRHCEKDLSGNFRIQ